MLERHANDSCRRRCYATDEEITPLQCKKNQQISNKISNLPPDLGIHYWLQVQPCPILGNHPSPLRGSAVDTVEKIDDFYILL